MKRRITAIVLCAAMLLLLAPQALAVGIPPGEPTNLRVVNGHRSAMIYFTPPANGGSGVVGYKVIDVNSNQVMVQIADGSATSILLPELKNTRTYTVAVVAMSSAGDGPRSAAVTLSPQFDPNPSQAAPGQTAVFGNRDLYDAFTDIHVRGTISTAVELISTPNLLHTNCKACDAIRKEVKAGNTLIVTDLLLTGGELQYAATIDFPVPDSSYNGKAMTVLQCRYNALVPNTAVASGGRLVVGDVRAFNGPVALLKGEYQGSAAGSMHDNYDVPPEDVKYGVTAKDNVRLYTKAGSKFAKSTLRFSKKGSKVKITGESGSYYEIAVRDDVYYVLKKEVTLN